MCKFSIIVPCYNSSENIAKLAASMVSQDYSDYEVVFVDDCSRDDSFEMLKKECAKHTEFRAYQTPQNGGPGLARNFGLKQAKGAYILFCDSDDEFDIDCLKVFSSFLDEHPQTDMIVSPHEIIRNEKCEKLDTYSEYEDGAMIPAYAIAKGNGGPVSKVYKRSIIQDNHVVFAPRMIGEDKYFVVNYAKFVKVAFKLDVVHYRYCMNSQSLTHRQGQFVYKKTVFDLLQSVYTEHFPEIEEIMFVEDHLLEQAKQMYYGKCSCKEIKEWFARENQRFPNWIQHVDYGNQSIYRKIAYKAIYKSSPLLIKSVMFLRDILY